MKLRPGTPHERGRRVAAESQLHEDRAEGVRWAHRRERDTKLQIAPTQCDHALAPAAGSGSSVQAPATGRAQGTAVALAPVPARVVEAAELAS